MIEKILMCENFRESADALGKNGSYPSRHKLLESSVRKNDLQMTGEVNGGLRRRETIVAKQGAGKI